MRRRPESHVSERDDTIRQMEEFYSVANKQEKDIETIITKLEQLESETTYLRRQYNQIRSNLNYDISSISKAKTRRAMKDNLRSRHEIVDVSKELVESLETIRQDQQWNANEADNLLNIINGYAESPAAFVGLGPFMDDEPNDEYGFQLTAEAINHLTNQGHTYFPYNP